MDNERRIINRDTNEVLFSKSNNHMQKFTLNFKSDSNCYRNSVTGGVSLDERLGDARFRDDI